MTNHIKIRSLSDLQRERELIREKIAHREAVLRDHVSSITEPLNPVLRALNFISGNRIFKGARKSGEGFKWSSIVPEIVMALIAGGFMFKKTRKNAMKGLGAFLFDQLITVLKEKDLTEYIDKFREWIAKYRKKETEDVEAEETTA